MSLGGGPYTPSYDSTHTAWCVQASCKRVVKKLPTIDVITAQSTSRLLASSDQLLRCKYVESAVNPKFLHGVSLLVRAPPIMNEISTVVCVVTYRRHIHSSDFIYQSRSPPTNGLQNAPIALTD